ncbi:MerR family transcriptional regulator [Clostridium sp. D53t1_180928_C8]|uniref:MerR family transcriptional regulator n=1 Tax=Clostridium sp. D53t1_180928_C8 TaxID=2787101 RepID=UPI0018AB0D7F|nr:MerR family transcriptional regulator [Clostridium sp. D53t1_180928_C8]
MANKNYILFTTGQFAKLHDINKRTLIYYDDIGLFSPAIKKDNGYRYYTYLQSPVLEMILTLRELDMSIEDIQKYLNHRSAEALSNLITTKLTEIDNKIKTLKKIDNLLLEKKELLNIELCSNLDKIEIVECKEEYLYLSESITDITNEIDLSTMIEHAKKFHTNRLFNHNFGSMISIDKLIKNDYNNADYFFTKIKKPTKKSGLFIKPNGRYIKAYCKGNWDGLPYKYNEILSFANENNLKLLGYAYEEGINELTIKNMDEYITQITIHCE